MYGGEKRTKKQVQIDKTDKSLLNRLLRAKTIEKHMKLYGGVSEKACIVRTLFADGKRKARAIESDGIYIIKILDRLGDQDSQDGEAYKACYPALIKDQTIGCQKMADILAVKMVPLTRKELENVGNNHYDTWREVEILRQINKRVHRGFTPNLPITYNHYLCPSGDPAAIFRNKNILAEYRNLRKMPHLKKEIEKLSKRKKLNRKQSMKLSKLRREYRSIDSTTRDLTDAHIAIMNELSDGDLYGWMQDTIKSRTMSSERLMAIVFQILSGLVTIQELCGTIHMDLHLSNVLVSKVSPGGFYHYRYSDQDYYVPIYMELAKLWDFGRSVLASRDTIVDKERIIKRVVRNYKVLVTPVLPRDITDIKNNLHEDFEGSLEAIQCLDTLRFLSAFYEETESIMKKRKIPRSKFSVAMIDLEEMVDRAFVGFSQGLIGDTEAASIGTARSLINEFYTSWQKKPKGEIKNDAEFIPFGDFE